MTQRHSYSRLVWAVLVCAAVWLAGTTLRAATDEEAPSLVDVIRRVLRLETRTAGIDQKIEALEARVAAMEKARQSQTLPASQSSNRPLLEILSPTDGSTADSSMVIVNGIVRAVDLQDRWPFVVLHPLLSDQMWVQAPPMKLDNLEEGQGFRCRVALGTLDRGKGDEFEIFLILCPKANFKGGEVLGRIPTGAPASKAIMVKRVNK